MIHPDDHILIERFIEGTLSGSELKVFQERMTEDEKFKEAVEFHNLLLSGISLSREQELSDYILSNVSIKQYTPRSVVAIVIVMLIIIASGIGVWNYLEKDAATGNRNLFTNNIFTKKQSAEKTEKLKQERKSSSRQVVAAQTNTDENSESKASTQDDTIQHTQATMTDSSTAGEKIIIKKDELITAAELPVIDKSNKGKSEEEKGKESLAKEAVEKLNPGAQLPEEESNHANTLQVEFWQSPVNYKGFKLMKNKLVLFGIDRPEAVKLYSLNDQLYIQYGQMVSKLTPAYDYQSFLVLRENEIPVQLK